jgi:DUF1680 family protein
MNTKPFCGEIQFMKRCRKALFVVSFLIWLGAARSDCAEPQRDYPFAPVPFTAVHAQDGFWGPRLTTNRDVTVWYDFHKCEETGRIDNFAVAGGLQSGGFQGIYFNDSDVVKVIEGAAYSLALQPDEKLDAYLDDLIAKIAAAQEDDGYLYTARTIGDPDYEYPGKQERWSHLAAGHELYNVGHMYEAAVAHFRATGKRSFLDVAIKNADLVCRFFGPEPGQRIDVPGHEEIEIGLVRLYRVTGDEKYLRQAKFFVDMRGRKDLRGSVYGQYCQDHQPLVDQSTAVGHAVRGGYLYAGVADVAALTGDRDYIAAIDRIWQDVIDCKLYLIGSVGQHGAGEGYAGAWKLDNIQAYNETCAAIALALWNQRMFMLHGDAKYIDVLERIIYNGFLSGVSLSGDRFFYPNPLACDMKFKFNHGEFERSPWFGCSCCPVNVVRFLPSIPGMVYATRQDNIYVNLYVNGQGDITLPQQTVHVEQLTDYPWNGRIEIKVTPERSQIFAIKLRIPGWLQGSPVPSQLYRYMQQLEISPKIKLNGTAISLRPDREGYVSLRRQWSEGDIIELDFPMPIRRVLSHENVEPNRGRVAVERGPIVYCVEGADHDGRVMNLFLPDDAQLSAEFCPELLGGVMTIHGEGQSFERDSNGEPVTQAAAMTWIPYYAWCHRGANEMQVWIPRSKDLVKLPPTPTIASEAKVTTSHCWSADSVQAVNDQQEPQNSSDHSIPRLTWWDHRGTEEWVQYEFKEPQEVSKVAVYWFDDTGRGHCRLPAHWKLSYRSDGKWHPAHGEETLPVQADCLNSVKFEPVVVDALRIDVQLQPDYSGGILEWRVD